MSQLIYQSSVRVFNHNLKNLAAILKLAARDARARGIEPSVLLNARLAPDMFPLLTQVQIAADNAKGCAARLAGIDVPVFEDNETSFAELDKRLKETLAFLRGLKAAQFEGSEAREVVMKLPIGTLRFSGLDYLTGWALPNFYFHYSAAYNILRHNGVTLGKRDFLGVVPGVQASGKIARLMAGK
ncbi:MAG: DUF1993 domain-containing protein [Pseudomonadales bacterium]|nr:DUF1993 domain-containing protein [Halieaceae bacterium]MCP5164129.1 DUF1993 domain-containing protein [Pseudomonadales bacterium]MCP5190493.1 DUF1993 domain-containing protein [Pseudomonadales bacterium]MCP5203795.1 DUF1993 domain-containing protein [Pseudomonadales bacterium]